MRFSVLFLSILLVSLAGCVQEPSNGDALDFLEGKLPDQGLSGRILIAAAAASQGKDLAAWPSIEAPILTDLAMPDAPGDAIRLLHALGMADTDAPSVTRAEIIAALRQSFDGQQFGFAGNIADDAIIITAFVAAGVDPMDEQVQSAAASIKQAQAEDGGWAWNGDPLQGQPDETAWIAHALAVSGQLDQDTTSALESFLQLRLAKDGSYDYAGTANCQSTGLSLVAWNHVGAPPASITRYLGQCQQADGGFPYLKGEPTQVWATAEIAQGLATL